MVICGGPGAWNRRQLSSDCLQHMNSHIAMIYVPLPCRKSEMDAPC